MRREVRTAKGQLMEARHSLEERAQDGVETVTERVRERPFASLGVAAGVGLVIGLLLKARR